jgi:hypothetical protein
MSHWEAIAVGAFRFYSSFFLFSAVMHDAGEIGISIFPNLLTPC